MNFNTIKAWLGETTTIQGCMAIAGGALWGWFHGDWATGATFIGLGVVGIIMRETPAQVIATARDLIAQAQQVNVQADTVKAEAATIITTKETNQ